MKNYGLFDVTFLFVNIYNLTNVGTKNAWHTFPSETTQSTQEAGSISDLCTLPSDRGPCRSYWRRYYYDSKAGQCRLFPYGGCYGNRNNFRSEARCWALCGNAASTQATSSRQTNRFPTQSTSSRQANRLTTQSIVRPVTRPVYPSTFRSTTESTIRPAVRPTIRTTTRSTGFTSIVEGEKAETCGENEVHDPCGSACPLTCENYRSPSEVCTLQCMIGCRCVQGYVRAADWRCVTTEQCAVRHSQQDTRPEVFAASALSQQDICQLEKKVGPCQGAISRYYYNKQSGQCEQFTFGGCGGNLNSFPTIEDCNTYCVGVVFDMLAPTITYAQRKD